LTMCKNFAKKTLEKVFFVLQFSMNWTYSGSDKVITDDAS